jgi:hypothetical protein
MQKWLVSSLVEEALISSPDMSRRKSRQETNQSIESQISQ